MIDLKGGKQIHGYTVKLGSNLVLMVANMLLSMYAKCGIPDDATKFFEEMSFKDCFLQCSYLWMYSKWKCRGGFANFPCNAVVCS